MTDFGVSWTDGEMLMRATGDVHVVHLGRDDDEGYISVWSRRGGVCSTHVAGPRRRVLLEWARLRSCCFRPRREHLDMVRFPTGE